MTAKKSKTPQAADLTEAVDRRDDDSLWKDIIERFFYPMLERAIPMLYADADTNTPPRFLDKELKKATYGIKGGKHIADFLVEVPLKDGSCEWILGHLEIRGKGGGDLPLRMFHYKALIFAMYKRDSVALAIITDNRPKAEPEFYQRKLYNTAIAYEYNRLVVAELDERELLSTNNPFDLALCAAQRALKSKRNERQKHTYLKELLGLLGDRGWSHEDKHRLLLFMEKIINLQDRELILDVVQYQEALEEEGKIMYVSLAERVHQEKWMEAGKREGIREGKREEKIATARKLLACCIAIDVIAQATGLTEEEIRGLMN